MRTVLFLGAGATRAQYESDDKAELQRRLCQVTREADSEILPPPLDYDFTGWATDRCTNNMPEVAKYLERRFQTDLVEAHKTGQIRLGMEWVFTQVWSDLRASAHTKGDVLSAYRQLLIAYRKLIAVSTIPLYEPTIAEGTAFPTLFASLARSGSKLSVVTTNQDLLVENLLAPSDRAADWKRVLDRSHKPSMRFRELYGLGRKPAAHDDPSERPAFPDAGWPRIPICKIHGSFNWLYASEQLRRQRNLPAEQLYVSFSRWPAEKDGVFRVDDAGNPLTDDVLIVPPVPKKDQMPRVLRPIWRKAASCLSKCDRLIVFGYGFPKADLHVRDLLSASLKRGLKEAVVIDIRPEPAKELQEIIDSKPNPVNVLHFRDVYEYTGTRR